MNIYEHINTSYCSNIIYTHKKKLHSKTQTNLNNNKKEKKRKEEKKTTTTTTTTHNTNTMSTC